MTARAPLFPGLTSAYLKSMGELMICASRLQRALDSDDPLPEAWRDRGDELVSESLRLADAVAAARAERVVTVALPDGTAVVADLDYVVGLVRKMHRHYAVSMMHAAIGDGQQAVS
jgi:hypothetical protein